MAAHFNKIYPSLYLKQLRISVWLQDEAKWRAEYEGNANLSRSAKKVCQTQHPEVMEMLDLWVSKAMADNILLTGKVLCQKWKTFADLIGVPDDKCLNLSEGWLSWFKAASAASEIVEEERLCIQELIKKHGYQPRDIFNADESSLFYAMPPDRGLSNKQTLGIKGKKICLTYLSTTNADGSQKLPPLVIGKAHKPWAFKNKTAAELGFLYRNNAKAWMTSVIYQEWLLNWDRALRNESRKILLLQDNFSGHTVLESLTNIHVENFKPNLTTHVQPNDQGIIHCFKAKYHANFIHCAVDLYKSGVTPSQIYDINQLDAMRLANLAWNDVDTTTIQNCWHKANILPDTINSSSSSTSPSVPISSLIHTSETHADPVLQAEKLVSNALDELEATGALQKSNCMALTELLNPAMETHNMYKASDKDIFTVVMDAKKARETNMEGDEVSNDLAIPAELGPTHKEALQASLLLWEFVSDMDSPFARNLEVMLCSFGHRTQDTGSRYARDGEQ
ncbi:hypothetical protein PISMIDRAFT_12163 [Pisolithus microcarpus 441]|uniref:Unplaced genomic scaffold scaffold_65, whole genome shotgun sequence n=1 Tax=Pisolithus microcarpus 441 TaxID=765257 RepID=A0A0C9Z6D4_9AGAM|nr:hypothetical protein PISMIDRAFT_12163 [Pisolithus microcarpus 441]